MSRFTILLSLLALPALTVAQIPSTVSFQGLITNTDGEPLDSLIDLSFTLYDTLDSPVWMETHLDAQVDKGIYNVRLGTFSSLTQISFDQPYELGITVGEDPEMVPRTPFDAVPYVLSSVCPIPTCEDLSLSTCTAGCVDFNTDESHCGGCDQPCNPGERCQAGTCALSCQVGLTQCTGVCTNLQSDESNCGECGNPCGSGELCQGGICSPA